jgi:hypothetical protein
MGKVKTHTFKNGKYNVVFVRRIGGMCDVPKHAPNYEEGDDKLEINIVLDNGSLQELDDTLHEGMHADGYPDEVIHDKEGYSDTRRLARFMWRCGWRKAIDPEQD